MRCHHVCSAQRTDIIDIIWNDVYRSIVMSSGCVYFVKYKLYFYLISIWIWGTDVFGRGIYLLPILTKNRQAQRGRAARWWKPLTRWRWMQVASSWSYEKSIGQAYVQQWTSYVWNGEHDRYVTKYIHGIEHTHKRYFPIILIWIATKIWWS